MADPEGIDLRPHDNPPVMLTTADLRYLASVMSSLATWAEAKAARAQTDPVLGATCQSPICDYLDHGWRPANPTSEAPRG